MLSESAEGFSRWGHLHTVDFPSIERKDCTEANYVIDKGHLSKSWLTSIVRLLFGVYTLCILLCTSVCTVREYRTEGAGVS